MRQYYKIEEIFKNYTFDSAENNFFNYQIIKEKGKNPEGRYGVVYKAINSKQINQSNNTEIKAIKFLKPEHALSEKAKKDFLDEIKILSEINHPNIIKIYDWGNLFLNSGGTKVSVPYYVMEYIDGKDLEKALLGDTNHILDKTFFEKLIYQILSALVFCHKQTRPILHLDIKPDNILIDSSKTDLRFVLTDFGKAKLMKELLLKKIDHYETAGGGIYKYVHPDIRPHLRKNKVPDETFLKLKDKCDLYSIGKVFKDVIEKINDYKNINSTLIPWTYLINDLCYQKSEKNEYYDSMLIDIETSEKALNLVEKLLSKEVVTNELFNSNYTEKGIALLRLPDKETIPFPKIIATLIDTPEFQKLRNISQLAVTDLVYPGATHTRFSHAIGAYYRSLSYIEGLIRNPLFRYIYSAHDIESVILAALLHDVGHYPFAHYLEEIKGLTNLTVHHEKISNKILTGKLTKEKMINSRYTEQFFGKSKTDFLKNSIENEKSLSKVLTEIGYTEAVNGLLFSKKFRGDIYEPLRKIISGPIDCDKLDYLIRDSKYSGVPYAETVDLDRFYYSLTIDTETLPKLDLAISAKGKSAVESIISSRYNLFSEVYWHKTCRSITTMVKSAFFYAHKNITQDEFDWATIMLNDIDFIWWLSDKINDKQVAFDLLSGIKISDTRKIYKRFRTYSHGWREREKLTLYNHFVEKMDNDFSKLNKYQKRLVEIVNNIGKEEVTDWIDLSQHHILIDIPNLKFDNYAMLKIKYPPSVEGKTFYSLSDISPLADAIYTSLSGSTKKVRLFVHPKFNIQLNLLKDKIDDAINEAFS